MLKILAIFSQKIILIFNFENKFLKKYHFFNFKKIINGNIVVIRLEEVEKI